MADMGTITTQGLYGDIEYRMVTISTIGLYDGFADVSYAALGAWLASEFASEQAFKYGATDVSTIARPLTEISTSSDSVTYGRRSAQDASAWDLSAVQAGHIATNNDGWVARISAVDDGGDNIGVVYWGHSNQVTAKGATFRLPDDGVRVSVLGAIVAEWLRVYADPDNTDPVYLGFDDAVTVANGIPILATAGPCAGIELSARPGRWINLGQIWVIAATDQKVRWIIH